MGGSFPSSQPFQFYSSPLPQHSSQAGLEQHISLVDEDDIVEEVTPTTKNVRTPWTHDEEICLAKAWSTISNDARIDNDKKNKEFCARVAAYYNDARPDGTHVRMPEKIKSHYYKVMPEVTLFSQWYNNFFNNRASGQSDEDILDATQAKWRSTHLTKEFKYLHVWKVMKLVEKWNPEAMASNPRKKSKTSETDSPTSGDAESTRTRPMGQQKAKAKAKDKGKTRVSEIDAAKWEKLQELQIDKIKQKSLELEINQKSFAQNEALLQLWEWDYCEQDTSDFTPAKRLLEMHEEKHGFPGMLGSLDCMHWEWRNCPVAWKGQYTRGDHGVPTIVLEAVASQDLWIWHAFFGVVGSSNDINVLHGSPLFNDVLQGYAPEVHFTVNGTTYDRGYYLTDGIYPEWASFVKSFPVPQDEKRKKFKERQESARKDVERAFGVLQSCWAIIRGPARSYFKKDLGNIIYTCIILHNMIIENEGEEAAVNWDDEDTHPTPDIAMGSNNTAFESYLHNYNNLCDKAAHFRLQADLTEHIWQKFTSN